MAALNSYGFNPKKERDFLHGGYGVVFVASASNAPQ
jgi:hypothetical protein